MQLPLRPELFWDVDINTLDEQTHKNYIIQQVFNYGEISEFNAIMHYYNRDTIKNAICKAGYLDPKTLAFVLTFFNLHKNQLLCCTRNQSHPTHWNS